MKRNKKLAGQTITKTSVKGDITITKYNNDGLIINEIQKILYKNMPEDFSIESYEEDLDEDEIDDYFKYEESFTYTPTDKIKTIHNYNTLVRTEYDYDKFDRLISVEHFGYDSYHCEQYKYKNDTSKRGKLVFTC